MARVLEEDIMYGAPNCLGHLHT